MSTNQPVPPFELSVAMRQRKRILCPAVEGGRSMAEMRNWPELPVHATRPAIGLLYWVEIVALYGPAKKRPPAAMISTNAPPLTESSSTAPSKVDSVAYWWANRTWALEPTMSMEGEVSVASLTVAGSEAKTEFGGDR